ncbi:MAG: hypothetical protein COT24_02340 [Candidatus Kerfeldbacteria bacterium CG08_land_8_20_14_0_20_40_16]|uniref:Phosphofructokinase domain-containing protein n=1 Tax=Candidatus Kerfeldbacteria bacterium CG08_land_8_20_14_0_20_40_16 TaxID=2014244 RepID=A0A2H0YWK5_9BACT|nr:MAG: hypothetical protein COT24_02340 [Candidatus Kerfeldbacteria bacterium CG08_land_8_20_14_0_20_40_16]
MQKTILVFTGGGITAALNSTLYGVITEAQKKGFKILGGLNGWKCLLEEGKIVDLTDKDVSSLPDHGGTFLSSARTNPLKEENGIEKVKENIDRYKIDTIIPIGGDDTIGAAREVYEKYHIPVVAVPKTVDNDLSGTYFTPGFPSAAHKMQILAKELKEDAAYGLKRVILLETLGKIAGWVAAAAVYGGADLILIPEKEVKLVSFLEKLDAVNKKNGGYAVVSMTEEVRFGKIAGIEDSQPDTFGFQRQNLVSLSLREKIKSELNIDAKIVMPRNYIQTGPPTKIDREIGIELGKKAVDLLAAGEAGLMSTVVRPDEKSTELKVDKVSLDKVVGEKNYRNMDENFFDFDNFMVKDEFYHYMEPLIERIEDQDDYQELIKLLTK